MTVITKRQGAPYVGLMTPSISGEVISDAVAAPSTTITAAAGAFQNLTTADNTGFSPGDIVEIVGSGPAGTDDWFTAVTIGNSNMTADTTKVSIRQLKPISAAVASAAMTQYQFVDTVYAPNSITLFNRATLDSYEWKRGYSQNTALKTSANGVRTKLTSAAIVQSPVGFWFHPSLIGLNNTLEWSVTFEMPAE
ncbi:hypothetical protein [Duganella sp. FT27W]|uniref:hypothetical protein n=1 Tax=Duganella sp. FT27W TaxID=2654636 RepID=UPI00128B8D52|nr:hypothetical protein [Duganella sp. FT27W]MPQ56323.1 hypothetical protein [Duganella sp. FT27W]